jgi:hypothetical protein
MKEHSRVHSHTPIKLYSYDILKILEKYQITDSVNDKGENPKGIH